MKHVRFLLISSRAVSSLAAMALIGACAGAPKPNFVLDRARSSYATAASDPVVASRAPEALANAEQTLRRAERSWRDKEDPAQTDHLSTLAEQQVALAQVEAKLKEYKAQQTRRGLILTLSDVLFETDRTDLRVGALANLEPLVAFLQANPDFLVAVEGHTDSTGKASYNEQLSAGRAGTVASYLVARGIAPERISTYGYGERYPIASNATPLGRRQNRRVELVVYHHDNPYLQPVALAPLP